MSETKMTNEIYKIYKCLQNDVFELHISWKFYKQLYGDQESVDILNESAINFFSHLQNLLFGNIILCVRRITDPKQTGKSNNLSFDQLVFKIDSDKDSDLKNELKIYLEENKDKIDSFRKLCDKSVVHNDLDKRIEYFPNRFPNNILIKSFEEVLLVITTFINKVEIYFDDSPYLYKDISVIGDANNLLSCLFTAKTAFEQKSHHFK